MRALGQVQMPNILNDDTLVQFVDDPSKDACRKHLRRRKFPTASTLMKHDLGSGQSMGMAIENGLQMPAIGQA